MKISPDSEAEGRRGEEMFRLFLEAQKNAGVVTYYCRPEWVVKPSRGDVFFVEVKTQHMFEAPPFNGHGLPVWQAERYLDLFLRTGIRTLLWIYDLDTGGVYEGWIDELHGRHFDTAGTRNGSRRIYPISSFRSRAAA